jgi:hypothetical protein
VSDGEMTLDIEEIVARERVDELGIVVFTRAGELGGAEIAAWIDEVDAQALVNCSRSRPLRS